MFPVEQSFGNDAAGLNLNDHVRHGVQETDQRHETAKSHRAAVMLANQVGRGHVSMGVAEFADSIPQYINCGAAQRDIQCEQGEHHALLVNRPGGAQHGCGTEECRHDGQRRNQPALTAPGEIVVLLARAAFANAPDADPEEKKEITREAEMRQQTEIWSGRIGHHSSSVFQRVRLAVTTTAACMPYQNNPQA